MKEDTSHNIATDFISPQQDPYLGVKESKKLHGNKPGTVDSQGH